MIWPDVSVLFTNLYIFVLAVVLAILEIQIEGEHGWAKNLPTWRPHPHTWYAKLYSRMMSGRELTGYHLTMFTFVFLIMHYPFAFGLPFTLGNELKVMSFFLIFVVMWDFLWFVLNPHYPISRFKKEHIWWHKKWALGLPADYYGGVILSGLILLPLYFQGDSQILGWWGTHVGLFLLQTVLTILFSKYVLTIDNWHSS